MATNPVTYRISPEVDAELRALADQFGGVDKALRVVFGAYRNLEKDFNKILEKPETIDVPPVEALRRMVKPPLLKPSEKKK